MRILWWWFKAVNFLFCCRSAQVILSCKIYAILVVSSLIKSRSYIARLFLWMLQITHCIHILPLLSIPRSLPAKDIGKESHSKDLYPCVPSWGKTSSIFLIHKTRESPIYLVKREHPVYWYEERKRTLILVMFVIYCFYVTRLC